MQKKKTTKNLAQVLYGGPLQYYCRMLKCYPLLQLLWAWLLWHGYVCSHPYCFSPSCHFVFKALFLTFWSFTFFLQMFKQDLWHSAWWVYASFKDMRLESTKYSCSDCVHDECVCFTGTACVSLCFVWLGLFIYMWVVVHCMFFFKL